MAAPNWKIGLIFDKVPKGGGGHFQSKIYVADFGNFKQGILTKAVTNNSAPDD